MKTTALVPASASAIASAPVVTQAPHVPGRLMPFLSFEAAEATGDHEFMSNWRRPKTIPAEVRNMLPAVIEAHEVAMAPTPPPFLMKHLAELADAFPNSGRDRAGWKNFIDMAIEDLEDFPPDTVLEAMRQHRRESKFYPTIAELRSKASALFFQRQGRIDRMRMLARIQTPEELAEQERIQAELKAAEWEAKLLARPDLRLADKWSKAFRGVSIVRWYPFLAATVKEYGFDTVDAWHAKASAELMFSNDDPMPMLTRLRDEHMDGIPK